MNINQIVEKIRRDMPKELEEIEIAKYIYMKLGKMKAYDEKYYFGSRKTKNKIYKLAKKTPERLDETMEKKKIICVSLSYLYVEILKRFGINSKVYRFSYLDPHIYNTIKLKDGTIIKADLQTDLARIQTGMKTKRFGTKDIAEMYEKFEEISDKENYEIDKKIGYVKDEKDYRDEDIKRLQDKCQGKSPIEVAKIIINDEKVNKLPIDMGYLERSAYYINLFRLCIKRNYFDIGHCYRYIEEENGSIEKKYKMILSVYDKNDKQLLYSFSDLKNKFIPIDSAIIQQIQFKDTKRFDSTYWSRKVNYAGIKKMTRIVRKKEKETKIQDYTK